MSSYTVVRPTARIRPALRTDTRSGGTPRTWRRFSIVVRQHLGPLRFRSLLMRTKHGTGASRYTRRERFSTRNCPPLRRTRPIATSSFTHRPPALVPATSHDHGLAHPYTPPTDHSPRISSHRLAGFADGETCSLTTPTRAPRRPSRIARTTAPENDLSVSSSATYRQRPARLFVVVNEASQYRSPRALEADEGGRGDRLQSAAMRSVAHCAVLHSAVVQYLTGAPPPTRLHNASVKRSRPTRRLLRRDPHRCQ